MVLKALFVDSPLAPIQGLDDVPTGTGSYHARLCARTPSNRTSGLAGAGDAWGPMHQALYEDLSALRRRRYNEARAAILSLRDNTAPEADIRRSMSALAALVTEYSWTDIVDTMLSR